MTPRKGISAKRRKAFFISRGGICVLCTGIVNPEVEAWDREHRIPLAMGGPDDESNWDVAHTKCHKAKTRNDRKDLAKAKRREAKNIGAKSPPKRPIPQRAKPEKPAKPEKLPLPPRRSIYG